jgi:hypothetical protein
MILLEVSNLKNTRKACIDIEKVKEEYITEFINLIERKKDYADYIDSTLENQKIISSQIKNTDWLIQSKLLLEQKKNEKLAAAEKAIKDQQEKELADKKKKEELSGQIDKLMVQYNKVQNVFATEGTSLENFEDSPSFKRLIDDLDRKKDLEQALFENKITVEDLQSQIRVLKAQKEVNARHQDPHASDGPEGKERLSRRQAG